MKKNVQNYKALKIIELSVFVILEIIFLIVVLTNKTMKTSIFVDKSLFTLCSIMYGTIIISLAFLVYDFFKLRELKIQSHELENLAYLDSKTGIPNRTSCSMFFENHGSVDSLNGVCCMVSEISNIKSINEAHGKDFGDKVIRDFSAILESSAHDYGFAQTSACSVYSLIGRDAVANMKDGTRIDLGNNTLIKTDGTEQMLFMNPSNLSEFVG